MEISPNLISNSNNEERVEGLMADQGDALTLELTDEQVASVIGNRIEEAKAWWNNELKLDDVRKRGEKYYLNQTVNEDELYEHQTPYKNNRIITAIETLVPMITSNPAQPIVTEAQDTDESRQLAADLQDVLLAKYEDIYMKAKLSLVARHLMVGKRVGILKYRFDPSIGKLKEDGSRRGGIVVEVVRPEKVVFEKEATNNDDVALIAEYLTATIEELCFKFTDKKEEIYKHFSIQRGVRSQVQRIVGYVEVWFSYYDKDGTKQEAVAWKIDRLVLGKMKNPNWNYDGTKQTPKGMQSVNFFDKPKKPYILFNHLTLGKTILDDTSLIEQSESLQDNLNKRGRQIAENADQAGSGWVFNENMISQEDAAKIIGDPSEKVMVAGDVNAAAKRLPPPQLPEYVQGDKFDSRAEIDNLFGANAPIRGESSGIKTLGQEVISQRANMGRLQSIADSIEDGMDRMYKAWVQMMMVYWDEPEIVRFQNTEGKTRFINWTRDKVEDGIQVRVKVGSVMPKDKQTIKNETMQLAGMLDPLTLAEGLDKENPKEIARRILYYRFEYPKYLAMLGEEGTEHDPNAMADVMAILGGQEPEVPQDPAKKYIYTLEKFLNSNTFKTTAPEQQQRVIEYMRMVSQNAKVGIGEGQQEQPPQEAPPAEAPPEEAPQDEMPPEAPMEAPPELNKEQPSTPMSEPSQGNLLQRGLQGILSRIGIGKN